MSPFPWLVMIWTLKVFASGTGSTGAAEADELGARSVICRAKS